MSGVPGCVVKVKDIDPPLYLTVEGYLTTRLAQGVFPGALSAELAMKHFGVEGTIFKVDISIKGEPDAERHMVHCPACTHVFHPTHVSTNLSVD